VIMDSVEKLEKLSGVKVSSFVLFTSLFISANSSLMLWESLLS